MQVDRRVLRRAADNIILQIRHLLGHRRVLDMHTVIEARDDSETYSEQGVGVDHRLW